MVWGKGQGLGGFKVRSRVQRPRVKELEVRIQEIKSLWMEFRKFRDSEVRS